MINLSLERQADMLSFAAQVQKIQGWRDDAHAIGFRDDGGCTRAVFVLENIALGGRDSDIHVASDGSRAWMAREPLRQGFRYIFGALGIGRLTAPVEISNVTAQIFCLKVGFEFEGRKIGAAPDGQDMVLMGMTSTSCPWLDGGTRDGR